MGTKAKVGKQGDKTVKLDTMGYKSKNDVQGGTDVNVGKNGVRGTVVYKSKSGVQ